MPNRFDHDPDDVLDYGVKLRFWLNGDTIASATIADVDPAGLGASQPTIVDNDVVSIISGGVENTRYRVTFRVNTNGGRTRDFTLTFDCRNR